MWKKFYQKKYCIKYYWNIKIKYCLNIIIIIVEIFSIIIKPGNYRREWFEKFGSESTDIPVNSDPPTIVTESEAAVLLAERLNETAEGFHAEETAEDERILVQMLNSPDGENQVVDQDSVEQHGEEYIGTYTLYS